VFELTGRVALVTGAGQGVGAGIAACLARQGARVIVNDLDAARADATVATINEAGALAVAAPFDVIDPDAVDRAVRRASSEIGASIDILVNNAGVPPDMELATFADLEPDRWRRYVDLNLYGSLHCIRAVLPDMRSRGWGRIIQISSGAGQAGTKMGISLYGASKSAIEGFLRHLSQEVAAEGITVNALALGLMDNVLSGEATAEGAGSSEIVASLARTVPAGRLGTPEDAGAAVAFVASDEAGWLTGQTIQLNGGQTTS
jgi:3-oxoacyl-[acyl-carrier protein] reductase